MEIGILDSNTKNCNALCSLVKNLEYNAIPIHTLEKLLQYLKKNSRKAIILNIDTIGINNKVIKEISRKYQQATFLCMSETRFHPDFKEAIRNHIFACLNTPIDADELKYFLKSIDKSRMS
ncbi:MAG: hypothetical protein L3J69_06365 [Desulfobacula sp.]|nr:hypothetical protein [Desulfobacula sp.]